MEQMKWGLAIVVSMVLGGALVVGINELGSDESSPSAPLVADVGTSGATVEPTASPAVNTVSQTTQSVVADLYEVVRPSIVQVNAGSTNSNSGGVGSGIVIDTDGHILTNNHVIDGFDAIDVVFADGTSARAAVVGSDPGNDLAVIKVEVDASVLVPATFGDSDAIRAGEFVIAVGNPFDLEGSVTEGIVSGIGRSLGSGGGRPLRQLIQADAAINPGNSGGGLFNADGHVIGITTAIENPSGDRVFVGIGYAVPSNVATRFLPRMLNGETVEHPRLGIELREITPSVAEVQGISVEQGVLIVAVGPGTGADDAGLRGGTDSSGQATGDVIVKIDDQVITNFDDLANYIDSREVGDVVDVVVIRDGTEVTVPVRLNAWQSN